MRSAAFWDSSVLVPLCLAQQASARHYRLARETTIVAWWATTVEVHSAICRYYRGSRDSHRHHALMRLAALRSRWIEIAPSDRVRDLAEQALDLGELRAADALQLASALLWCHEKPRDRIFATGDQRLGAAATGAGFTVELF